MDFVLLLEDPKSEGVLHTCQSRSVSPAQKIMFE